MCLGGLCVFSQIHLGLDSKALDYANSAKNVERNAVTNGVDIIRLSTVIQLLLELLVTCAG